MDFQDEDLKEFILEATELLDIAEQSLLNMDSGQNFSQDYDAVFRAFHSIKGAAGMMHLTSLQAHMHQLENIFTQFKGKSKMEKVHGDFFLRGVDGARQLLEGKEIKFDYSMETAATPAAKPAAAAAPVPTPVTVASKPVPVSAATSVAKPIKHPSTGKIMVIDDEPDITEILSDMLSSQGFSVVTYTDPEKAVADFPKVNPYLVLSDFSMPKLSGMQVLQKLSQFDADIPLIFVSGYITNEVLMESIALGVYGIVEKPFDEKKVIQLALNGYRRYEMIKLLNRSIKLIMYQFSDLDDFLKKQGKEEVRKLINNELNQLLTQHRALKKAA